MNDRDQRRNKSNSLPTPILPHQADSHEISNLFDFTEALGSGRSLTSRMDFTHSLYFKMQRVIATCRNRAVDGIDMPFVCSAAGRLFLLLESPLESLEYYARGIRHFLATGSSNPEKFLKKEARWLQRLNEEEVPPSSNRWAAELLALAGQITTKDDPSEKVNRTWIMTGGAAGMNPKILTRVKPLVKTALEAFHGVVISGGTDVGLPGLVGAVAAELAARNAKFFELVGYIPEHLPPGIHKDSRYDRFVLCGQDGFSPDQILHSWQDLLDQSIHPRNVLLLGFGGGPLSALEYRLALAFGASVAVVTETEGAAEALLHDELWSKLPNLRFLSPDKRSVCAFI